MNKFPNRLQELRAKTSTTQKVLAEYLDVTSRHVQRYESGQYQPSIEGLINLADFFGVSIDYLVGRTDNPETK